MARIIHVTPFYHPVIGGVEEVVKRVAEYMAKKGNEVYVITYNRLRKGGYNILPKEEVINEVRVIRLKPDFIWSHGTYSSKLPQVIKAIKPDLVHVHVWRHPHVFQVAKLRRTMGFKAVLHGHAPFHKISQLGITTWIYHRLMDSFGKDYLKMYDTYIALTPYETKRVRNMGLDYSRVTVIPNGIPEDSCVVDPAAKKEHQILYLGRISVSKNLDLLIKATSYVIKTISRVELVLAGPDEGIIKGLLKYAAKKGVRAKYLGEIRGKPKHKLYIESIIYALPSLYEAFGITLLEAGMHATPSVITGKGGQLYTAPPNRASLWTKPNPKNYAEAIATLLTDRKLRKKLGQQAREWAKMHTWNRILPKYERLYEKLMSC